MGVRDIAGQILARAASALGNGLASDGRSSFKIGWSLPPRRTTDLWADIFHKSPMLDPVDMIASDLAAIPYRIFNKAQFRKDPVNAMAYADHPIYDLLDHPMPDHPEIDFFQLMYLTDTYYEVIGDTFWLIDRKGTTPCGIYPVPPSWMLRTPTMYQNFFRIQPMGNTSHKYFDADPADVVWFKAPDATNPFGRGRARAEAIGDEIETHEYAAKYAKNLFYNDAVPPIILEMPGIQQKEAEEFKENWMQKLGGYLNARKPGIVSKKDFKVHQLTTTPREMDFIEGRKYLIELANEHYCAPPELRGNISNSNRATIDSSLYLWTKRVISKRAVMFGSALNNQFVPMFNKVDMWRYDDIVPEDAEFKLEVYNAGLSGGTIMVNEWRLAHRMVAVPGGDVFLRPMAIVSIPGVADSEVAPKPADTPDDAIFEDENEDNEDKIDLGIAMKELESATNAIVLRLRPELGPVPRKRSYSTEARIAAWKSLDAAATGHEGEFTAAMAKVAKMQRAKCIEAFDIGIDIASVFGKDMDTKTLAVLNPAFMASLQEGYTKAIELLYGPAKANPQPVSVYNQQFSKRIATVGFDHVKSVNKTTVDALKATVQEGRDNEESIDEIRNRITSTLAEIDVGGYRAANIARTETMGSMNYGSLVTYKGEGVEKKEWLATMDSRTRDDHAEADGQIVGIDEDFKVGGFTTDAPGNTGDPSEDCACRCSLLPVIGEE